MHIEEDFGVLDAYLITFLLTEFFEGVSKMAEGMLLCINLNDHKKVKIILNHHLTNVHNVSAELSYESSDFSQDAGSIKSDDCHNDLFGWGLCWLPLPHLFTFPHSLPPNHENSQVERWVGGIYYEVMRLVLAFGLGAVLLAQPSAEIRLPAKRFKLSERAVRDLRGLASQTGVPLEKRISAIGALGLAKSTEAVETFTNLLLNDRQIEIKVASAFALAQIADPRALSPLLSARGKIIRRHQDFVYDGVVVFEDENLKKSFLDVVEFAIRRCAVPVVPQLVQAVRLRSVTDFMTLPQQKEPESVGRARSALGVLAIVGNDDYRAIRTLLDVLTAPDVRYPPDFKFISAQALGEVLKERKALFYDLEKEDKMVDHTTGRIVRAMVSVALSTEIKRLPRFIAEQLSQSRPGYATAYILGELSSAADSRKRMRVVELIGLVGDPSVAYVLLPLAKGADGEELAVFVRALGRLRNPIAYKFIEKCARSRYPEVRRASVRSLGDTGLRRFVPLLSGLLLDEDAMVRKVSAIALGRIRHKFAIPALESGLRDEDPDVAFECAYSISLIDGEKGFEAFLRNHLHNDARVRALIYLTLGSVNSTRALRAIVDGLADSERTIASHCSRVITRALVLENRRPRALRALEKAVADSSCPARAQALRFLRNYFAPGHIKLLKPLLESKDERLRELSAEGLFVIGKKDASALKILKRYLNDPNNLVRNYARIAKERLGE